MVRVHEGTRGYYIIQTMAKRSFVVRKKVRYAKKSPKRLAAKKRMLEIKAMKPAARKKALLENSKNAP
ncbi:MAG: hypothetical protein A3C04_03335 [Candidatus Wildermuthbacteria bacterium RIFCSPHIGHO2_02_FULL_45_25]|uniref:Uncharacterized protein n=1 Tax=Candidatus Wildermuthbacteria bacterium RIFCSPHIGHO2_02_FULL_45_25 TaxID=1802450 RepID=A0A1G2R1V7_9BACT|nr:MAG: hypothetical protein A3C04_03335 [Candidatus Wildermuthbacteria bacterium RIFCSPHIGHO2_02_FULL_45_25]